MKPRDFALHQLDAKRLPNWPPHLLKGRKDSNPPADPRDLALADNIATGVVKNLLLLQYLIEHFSDRSLKSIDPLAQKILAIALYQLRFLDRIPASAAVDEAVEQTRRFRLARASGFVNAILRKATREPSPPLPARDDPEDYARIVLSHPPELFRKLQSVIDTQAALDLCEHDQREPPTIVRMAANKDPVEDLASPGVTWTPHEQPNSFVVNGAKRPVLADWAQRGIAQVQDPTASLVIESVHAEPGQTVLDRCCGLGTKTIQLRERVGESGHVFAMDPAKDRCEGLRRLLERRGLKNVTVHCAGWLSNLRGQFPAQFDRILVDAPCSNSGVLARRPEARYHQSPQNLRSLVELQDRILDDSARFVRTGGVLVYSTCSVWPEENRQRALAFEQRHPDFSLVRDNSYWPPKDADPTRYRDGGYIAELHRK